MAGAHGSGRPNTRRSAYATRDLTTGSIPKNLWFLAWPQVIEGVLRVADQLADLIWAGHLGTKSLAGIGVSQQYIQIAFTARSGIDTSQRAMVSRAIGAGNTTLANHVVFQALTLTVFYSIAMLGIGLFLTEPMLRLLGVSQEVTDIAAPYMRLQFAGQGFFAFQGLAGQALAAAGDTLTPMRSTLVTRVTKILLSPLLIFGVFGLPELGLVGAAIATMVGNCAGMVMNLRNLFLGRSRLHLRPSDYRLDARTMWQLLRIGIPASINGMERALAQILLVGLVAPFGDTALAAFTLTRRVEMFANLGGQGLGQASGTIVGQSIGAGRPERAKTTVMWAAGYAVAVTGTFSVIVFIFPHAFLSIFTSDPALLAEATIWLRIQCAGYVVTGLGNILTQSFMTAGDTGFPAFVTLATIWGVQQPVAYVLSRTADLDQYGIAWAVVIALASRLVIYVPYFFSGRWLRIRVFDGDEAVAAQSPPDAGERDLSPTPVRIDRTGS